MLCHGSRCCTAGFKIKRNGSIFSCARAKPRSLDSKVAATVVIVVVIVVVVVAMEGGSGGGSSGSSIL